MFLVYSEVLGWAIGEEGFEQLASVIKFMVEKSVVKYTISVPWGCFIKDYLWQKKTLSSQLLLLLPVKIIIKKTRQITRVHSGTRRCMLHQLFAVKFGCMVFIGTYINTRTTDDFECLGFQVGSRLTNEVKCP